MGDTRYDNAIGAVIEEINAAHTKHGLSFERAGVDKKLRIMVEEVGEIADAIQLLEEVHDWWDAEAAKRELCLEDKRMRESEIDHAIEHLREEIAQVGACAVRWLQS